jgi:ABC-type Mn2+/Zn2+ transport system ATPase subunit
MSEEIVARRLNVRFDGRSALEDIDVRIPVPSVTIIIGPNGAGKSTFLRTLIGSVRPASGSVEVLGMDPATKSDQVKRAVSYVAQKERFSYPVPIKVSEVVMMGLLVDKAIPRVHGKVDDRKVADALHVVDMDSYFDAPFDRLSGGQQQRVLLARSIIRKPKLLLLDEPFNAVDVLTQCAIIEHLQRLRNSGVGILLVTHDSNPLARITEYVMVLDKRLVGFGPPRAVLKQEVLAQVYGGAAKVLDGEPCPYVVLGDIHA